MSGTLILKLSGIKLLNMYQTVQKKIHVQYFSFQMFEIKLSYDTKVLKKEIKTQRKGKKKTNRGGARARWMCEANMREG